jgi:hypothetical protein
MNDRSYSYNKKNDRSLYSSCIFCLSCIVFQSKIIFNLYFIFVCDMFFKSISLITSQVKCVFSMPAGANKEGTNEK